MVTQSDSSSIHMLEQFDSFSDDDASMPGTAGLSTNIAALRHDSGAYSRPLQGGG